MEADSSDDDWMSCDEDFSKETKDEEESSQFNFSAVLFTRNLYPLIFDLKFLSPCQKVIIRNLIDAGGGLLVSDVEDDVQPYDDEIITLVDEQSTNYSETQPVYSIRYVVESAANNRLMSLCDYKLESSSGSESTDVQSDSEKFKFSFEAEWTDDSSTLLELDFNDEAVDHSVNEVHEPTNVVHENQIKVVQQQSIGGSSKNSLKTPESSKSTPEQTQFISKGNRIAITTGIEAERTPTVSTDSGNAIKPYQSSQKSRNEAFLGDGEVAEKCRRRAESEVTEVAFDGTGTNGNSDGSIENTNSLSSAQSTVSNVNIDRVSKSIKPVPLVAFTSVFRPSERSRGNENISYVDFGTRMAYSYDEDLKLLKTIVKRRLQRAVKGRAMWTDLEEEGLLNGRTWQSMKERYNKRILPQIYRYPEISLNDAKKCVDAFGFDANKKHSILLKCEALFKKKTSTVVKKTSET